MKAIDSYYSLVRNLAYESYISYNDSDLPSYVRIDDELYDYLGMEIRMISEELIFDIEYISECTIDYIKPYLIDLNAYFTQYKLENILEMKSFYGIRLYELLRSEYYKDENTYQEYSIEFLRQFFDCETKYKAFKDFRVRVLEIALKEINEKSDIYVYEGIMIKTGRKITGIKFLVGYNFRKLK